MNALNQKAKLLKDQAFALYHRHLQAYLAPYGQVDLLGSFALDLMVWPDLDLQLVLAENYDRADVVGEISKKLMRDNDVRHVKLIHFTERKDSPFGLGMYLGIQFYEIEGLKWKVDCWMKSPEDRQTTIQQTEHMLSKLDDESRQLILRYKHKLLNKQGIMPKLASYYLYQAILDEGLRSEALIYGYLKEHDVILG